MALPGCRLLSKWRHTGPPGSCQVASPSGSHREGCRKLFFCTTGNLISWQQCTYMKLCLHLRHKGTGKRHSEKNQCVHLWHKRQIRKSWGDKCAVSVCLPACSILGSFSCPTFTSPSAMLLLNGSVRRAVHSPGLHSWSSEPLTYTKRDSQHRGTMRFSSKTQRYRDSWREDGYSLTGVETVTESWFLFSFF